MAKEQRLIDADMLIKSMREEDLLFPDVPWSTTGVQKQIDKLPTMDVVEVVRCEKCLYRSQYPDENGDYKCGGLLTEDEELILMVKPDFFCAYGERRGKDAVD